MTILALLVALAIERVTVKMPAWQAQAYAQKYFSWSEQKGWLSSNPSLFTWLLLTLVPALACSLVLYLLPGALFDFFLHTIVLFICLGSQQLRETYKCFLQAANRGDVEACYLYAQQMGHCDTKADKTPSFGLRLVWLNYQHYAAVVLFFVAFGAPGAVFYVAVREAFEFACQQEDMPVTDISTLRNVADFIPVRLSAFGLLMVGNFTHAMPVWLQSLAAFGQRASDVLANVASAAEVLPDEKTKEEDPAREPAMLVTLAKRNLLFLLVVVSLLTVFGAI